MINIELNMADESYYEVLSSKLVQWEEPAVT